jgi:hypothetical protein
VQERRSHVTHTGDTCLLQLTQTCSSEQGKCASACLSPSPDQFDHCVLLTPPAWAPPRGARRRRVPLLSLATAVCACMWTTLAPQLPLVHSLMQQATTERNDLTLDR